MLRRWLPALALAVLSSVVHAQTVVRACPTQPTTSGFSACANSTWSLPASSLIVDVLRAGVATDVWLTPNQLLPTDRVFACQGIAPGPYKACPSSLPGQTNNWLLATQANFGAPTGAVGQIDWSWATPTQNSDGTPLTDLAGFHLFVRQQAVSTYDAPIVLPASATDYLMKNLSVTQCAEIAAFNAAGADGVLSDEVCATPSIKASVPAKIVLSVKAP